MELDGKTALITGGGSGIGQAVAKLFASEGAKVALVDRDADRVADSVAAINADGGTAIAFNGDVSKAADVESYVNDALGELGRIDSLVNAAGIIAGSPIAEQEPEGYEKIVAVNANGTFFNLRYVLPGMIEQGSGSVVNIASISGVRGYAMFGAYAASKHAVIGLTRVAAAEVGPKGVRVNAVCPGTTKTAMWDDIIRDVDPDNPERVFETYTVNVPLQRGSEAEEQAQVVLFLASDRSSYITGEYILSDGGMIFSALDG